MTLHEDWHTANPGDPCGYDTCPWGQDLDLDRATYAPVRLHPHGPTEGCSMRRLRMYLIDRWVEWRVNRSLKAGAYDDPITTRRRLARAARPPEDIE